MSFLGIVSTSYEIKTTRKLQLVPFTGLLVDELP